MIQEMDKYYTPTIEEFHVGFEYEFKEKSEIFSFDKFPDSTSWNLSTVLDNNFIRVKYLDREDIESFGFIQDSYDSFSKGYVSLELDEDQLVRIDERKSEFNHRLFAGTIRNRSELKKILTQIGVI